MEGSGNVMPERWNVELTGGAVGALRGLPRGERERVARRIEHLVEAGLPPGLRTQADETGVCAVPAGDQVLMCMEIPRERRILIVTLRSEGAAVRPTVGRLLRHTLPRWLTEGMGGIGMGSIKQDLGFALRSLRRSPGFAATAVLTLALGIGATASIFSVANGVLLSPLPYGDSEGIVTIWSSWSNFPAKTWMSVAEYQYYHQNNSAFQDIAIYGTGSVNFTSVDEPERVGAAAVTPNTFAVLGVQPVVGRVFTWEESRDSISPIMIGYGAWQRRFDGDRSIIGRSVEINGNMLSVIGVLPRGFVLPVDFGSANVTEVFFPQFVDLETPVQVPQGGGSHGNYGVARLKDGETATSALADLENILDRLRAEGIFTEERNFHPRVYSVMDDILGTARGTIFVLLGAVGFVLLIACGNVANLLLSRSDVRAKEVAVRVALGAGRGRILRQLFTESLVMAGLAGAIGLGLAYAGVGALLAIDADAVPRSASISLDGTVVIFTVLVSALTAAVFGVIPALRVSRGSVGSTLHEGGRGGRRGRRSSRMQGLLVAAQMAMAVILLTGSGLMIKTFVRLLSINPGFTAVNVLTMRVTAPSGRYPDGGAVAGFYEQLLRRVRDVPGARRVGAARLLPLASQMGDSGFRPVWYQPDLNESTQADWQYATPDYIETMGIPLVEGRTFDERDVRGGQPVVMINEHLARRYWGEDSPLGSEVLAFGADTAVVVGVVGDVSHNGITQGVKDRYYLAHAQVLTTGSMRSMTLTIAAQGDPNRLIEPIRREIRSLDPSMPISDVQTVDDVLSASVAQPRFAMVLLGAFATLALTLALVGIYGVLAYTVSQRTREIGMRLALGAEAGQVIGLVVHQGMVMALAGVVAGTGMAWFMANLMQGLLYGVAPQDTATFVSVPALFSAVALLACWLPAARAARVRPASALRYE